jgi:prepilin-type N-terminal cleavage/methylation domain-containing protein
MSIKRVIKRKAFSLVEMVMVIVILGIVGMIGSDIIAKMYQGYIKSKITNDLQQKTELVIEQIVRRFGQRIKDTTIGRHVDVNAFINPGAPADGNHTRFMKLNDDNIATIDPNVVEWIGYDNESYIGESNGTYSRPGWSGFIDIDDATTGGASIATPGSDLNITNRVINTLSGGAINFAFALGVGQHPVLISKCIDDSDMNKFGWDMGVSGGDKDETIIVSEQDSTHFQMANIGTRNICEQYYLAWSAYALMPIENPDPNKPNDFNLTLIYNYQPWEGENYNNGTRQVLAEHISTFRVMQVGDSVRVKICMHDGNITGTQYTFCKEKAIF